MKVMDDYDPDILLGYEVHNFSWGYVIDRAKQAFGNIDTISQLTLKKP